jgi:1,4-dihydroxy-6-naphthoate synthase
LLAFENESDITKISFHSFFKVMNSYQLLNSGAALGENCGPLVISKRKIYPDELSDCKIAIPGVNTTANLLLQLLFPSVQSKLEYLFSDIEDAVLSGDCDAGLVIHETRFTYKERGLKLIADIGNLWEDKYNLPIPLGGIAIKRSLPEEVKKDISEKLRQSIEFAMSNPSSSIEFMKQYAQDMNEDVMLQHVDLYVNDYSLNLCDSGKESVLKLREEYLNLNGIEDKFVYRFFV